MSCPRASDSKVSACNVGDPGSVLGWEDLLEKEMATHSSILAWKIPWTEEPGGLQSVGWQRVGHDWATSLSVRRQALFHLLRKVHWTEQSQALHSVYLSDGMSHTDARRGNTEGVRGRESKAVRAGECNRDEMNKGGRSRK